MTFFERLVMSRLCYYTDVSEGTDAQLDTHLDEPFAPVVVVV